MRNPFEFGREIDSQELVNRTDEIRMVCETGSKLFVIGQRRFGKTSLLNIVTERLRKKEDIYPQL